MNQITTFFNRETRCLIPFEKGVMDFCEHLSQTLFSHEKIKQYPDIMALAFWLRKAHIEQLKDHFFSTNELLVPRGAAFHIAPANVETMFVYSWILSLLVGNANIVRLPSRENENLTLLFEAIKKVLHLDPFKPILETTCLLSYGHEESITAEISSKVDLRLIWGGDTTIQSIRRIPLSPSGKELVFPDRYSFAVVDSEFLLAQPSADQTTFIRNLYNDIFWYDQNACSSPRVIYWLGTPEKTKKASQIVYKALQERIETQKYTLPLGSVMQKETSIYGIALEMPIEQVVRYDNELTVVCLQQFHAQCRENQGPGLLYHISIDQLLVLKEWMTEKDQTLTYYGISQDKLKELAQLSNGNGVTRMVPVGQALNFDYLWDGYNLLNELVKTIQIY